MATVRPLALPLPQHLLWTLIPGEFAREVKALAECWGKEAGEIGNLLATHREQRNGQLRARTYSPLLYWLYLVQLPCVG